MKIKTSEAFGLVLDYLVAKAEGLCVEVYENGDVWVKTSHGLIRTGYINAFSYSTDWGLAGPIIEREKISVLDNGEGWRAYTNAIAFGITPLIAAMRCYCIAKFGHEAEVPEELMK